MEKKDHRIDVYIARSANFAKPVLRHLRKLIHRGCPDAEETLRWGHPSFTYKGLLCTFASFKEHCTFGFWKGSLIVGDNDGKAGEAMGQFGRITSLGDLPDDRLLLRYIRKAALLNEKDVKIPKKAKGAGKSRLVIPPGLADALRHNEKARRTFEGFSYSHKREYIQWLTEAKTERTRGRRLATAIAWLSEGKTHNWRYAGK